ncbi:fungal-specific transcription factor domain-containing protein [Aspergillus pseudotamarii]|uniref:Fungal-specific transcription factor domain-containing protein n=1 Tax=Aspergillus pseudotamarii TaxID=132259 RepID=A0A5N6SBZ5_ASPPS|nr:fungal-specific transcription factor domain-containing protein [Aspergillus pseudotamarii]KAE8130923.1 fungal-specific transcription factor domain-containing protein [Aspergillus pseudotamarii]
MDTSCYTCRRRRIECEMTEPPCKKCQKAGLECFQKRPFRWVQGAAFRSKKKVSSVKDASVSVTKFNLDSTRRDGSTNAKSKANDDASLEYGEDTPGPRSLGVDNVLVNPDDPYASSLDKVSKYYLYYYSKCVCKLFVMYDSKRNPLRNLIPAALGDSILLTSIIALSARHMANGGQSFYELGTSTLPALSDAHHNALWFKYKAIQEISHALSDEKLDTHDIVMASAFLLIFLDLLESGSDKWNVHLEGVKTLITQIQPMGSGTGTEQGLGGTVEEMRNFIIRQIYLIDTLGATYTRPRLLSNTTSLQEPTTPLQMSLDKSYLGCPEFLLDALRSFSIFRDMLAGSHPLEEDSLQSYIENISIVLNLTQDFDCRAWASNLPQLDTHSTHDTNMLSTLAEAYKAGTLIYGRRVSDALVGEMTPLDNLVGELIAIIEVMRCDEALFKCILWPMFVAGLESQQQDQRDFVVSCLEKFWFETKCINVVNAANILRRFWKMGDTQQTLSSQWIFNIGQLGRDWLLI